MTVSNMTCILIIDDDSDLLKSLSINLHLEGYKVVSATCGEDGIKMAYNVHPDLIVLDVMMPRIDGFETCAHLRKMTDVPILMLTARAAESDIVHGLQLGADDYIVKPFSQVVLEAHLRALLRRRNNHREPDCSHTNHYEDNIVKIDLESQQITCDGKEAKLTPIERQILGILISNLGRVVTHQDLIREVWGNHHDELRENLAVYISMLRKKCICTNHQYIQSQWGVGYLFVPRPQQTN
ncbi:response regulator transcription factor [bacterium]|nr:response regulator transcription factor [bacterium]